MFSGLLFRNPLGCFIVVIVNVIVIVFVIVNVIVIVFVIVIVSLLFYFYKTVICHL